ncbi:oxidoreductase [Gillisia limnaea]|uniref:Short-chain dehydrogenase/reductase SDR n=1 Tax=Gillisia limnaea (strain DSM 15749 / LMG 21470 / R-8282) TaxID=865937 RepID=H2BU57_GILLR|nr:oxidoreductase [Gillisia limnaea]EHQ01653.1 short-chain dehydrogenase/reductase SDR [Gillisia limnaea DSM 15749]
MENFNLNELPNQPGKIAIVTGANAGLGYKTTLGLVQKKVKVIMACRDIEKGNNSKADLLKEVPDAQLEILQIDLSSLKSVKNFAKEFQKKYNALDLLINNAGVMMPPYHKTEDGFELQMAANYFGHFALTGLLLDLLKKTSGSRVVNISSLAHKKAKIDFEDLQSEKNYSKYKAYGQSKLACLMFARELQRKLDEHNCKNPISSAVHPGVSRTELFRHFPNWVSVVITPLAPLFTQDSKEGSHSTLMASLDKNVSKGGYYGPQGFKEMKGNPGKANVASQAKNEEDSKKLWKISEKETGVFYSF